MLGSVPGSELPPPCSPGSQGPVHSSAGPSHKGPCQTGSYPTLHCCRRGKSHAVSAGHVTIMCMVST